MLKHIFHSVYYFFTICHYSQSILYVEIYTDNPSNFFLLVELTLTDKC